MKRLRIAVFAMFALSLAAFASGQSAAPTKTKAPSAAAKPVAAPVDINSASLADLNALPGIGDAYAAKIVAGRPYKMKTQLKTKNVIPSAVYEKIKNQIVATQK